MTRVSAMVSKQTKKQTLLLPLSCPGHRAHPGGSLKSRPLIGMFSAGGRSVSRSVSFEVWASRHTPLVPGRLIILSEGRAKNHFQVRQMIHIGDTKKQ